MLAEELFQLFLSGLSVCIKEKRAEKGKLELETARRWRVSTYVISDVSNEQFAT